MPSRRHCQQCNPSQAAQHSAARGIVCVLLTIRRLHPRLHPRSRLRRLRLLCHSRLRIQCGDAAAARPRREGSVYLDLGNKGPHDARGGADS
jgi:hypothetical protein